MDDHDTQVIADIHRVGWHIIEVSEDDEGPGFAYSIGLYQSYRHPEIIVFGLSLPVMAQIINTIGIAIKTGGVFEVGSAYPNIVENYSCIFQNVPFHVYPEYFGYATWFYGDGHFPALQCLWPDKTQHFPGEVEYDNRLAKRQPLLANA